MTSTTGFDRAAATFDRQRGFPESIADQLRGLVLAELAGGAHARLLDVGIGTGRFAAVFVRHGCRYTGLDGSREMLRRCRTRLAGVGPVDLVWGDGRRLPFPAGAFHAVIAASLFRVVAPWQAAAAEMQRVLAPGGSLILIHHNVAPDSMEGMLGQQKREILTQLGAEAYPAGGAGDDRVARWFAERGARVEQTQTDPWIRVTTPRACIDRYLNAGRVAGQPWASELKRRLDACAVARYCGLDREEPVQQTLRVYLIRLPRDVAG